MSADISVVIPTRNRRDELRRTLRGLGELGADRWQVIVVANDCTDGTDGMLAAEFPWVRAIALAENYGPPAINFGLDIAGAPVLMTLDDDALPTPGTVEGALSRFAADPELHALACAVEENGRVVNAHWAATTLSFIGCGAFFRTATLREIGGYAWEVPWLSHEKELVCRLVARGCFVSYDPACLVIHRRSPMNRSWDRAARVHARDTAYRIVRYYSPWCIPLGLLLVAGYHLASPRREGPLRPRDFTTLVRGMAEGVRKGLRKRAPVPARRRLAAGRVWRAEMPRRGRLAGLLARLAPPDFWY